MHFRESSNQTKAATTESGIGHLVVVGINYHSCPLFIREKFVIPDSCIGHALKALAQMPHLQEAAILSTCNRTEVYAVVSDVQAGLREIESFFTATQRVADHAALKPNFKLLREDVALHLFRVASGLDSMVLGEGQIMAQVKTAYKHALEAGTAKSVLGQLFQIALSCGKRVRTETTLGRRAVSVSSAAIELAREVMGPLTQCTSLVVGAGNMAQISAKHLLSDNGAGRVLMVNRTSERLEHFSANKLPNKERLQLGLSFADRQQLVAASDLVIVSTSAPSFLITKTELAKHWRGSKKLCIVDISVPRNVDPQVAELEGVSLFHADDLARVVNANLAEREALTADAEKLIFESLGEFEDWQRSLLVAPTITELRKKIEAIRAEHLIKHESKGHMDQGTQLEELSRALINQILHHPTTQLKSTSDYQLLKQQAEALRRLFKLDVFAKDECPAKAIHRELELQTKHPQ